MSFDEPIRILQVVQRMEAAGLQSFLMNIYRSIDRNKIQFDFLTHYAKEDFYDQEIQSLGGHIYRLTFREDKNFPKYQADLHHFFTEHPEYRIVHGHMDSLGYFYLGAAKRAGIPVRIAHAHNVLKGGDLVKRLRNKMNRLYKINATKLLACSEEAGRYMFGTSEFQVIHNPIEVRKFAYSETVRKEVRKELNIQGNLVIGHVGRFSHQKNHQFLLKVFKEILDKEPDTVLLLVGDGELSDRIKEWGVSLGIENHILYMGLRNDVERLYQAMDAFVFPSLYEGLGTATIEAQTSGLPVICSDQVSASAKASDLFFQLPLTASSKVWAEKIIIEAKNTFRRDYSKEIMNSGFDASDVSKELVELYMKLYTGEE